MGLKLAVSSPTSTGLLASLFTPQIRHWGEVSSLSPAGLPLCPGMSDGNGMDDPDVAPPGETN